jgi:glycosyltransferase involved in cell wall biosynthesis
MTPHAPLLLDLSHTSHTRARTGIQRVTRSLHAALGPRAIGITYDPHREDWRQLNAWERATLAGSDAAEKRGARWPLSVRLRGSAHRLLRRRSPALPENSGTLVPEVFSPSVAGALPELFRMTRAPRVAIFHDAIALKLPEYTAPGTVARFPAYLVELLHFDGVAAVSEDSRASLVDYWQWLGVTNPPRVCAIPLGVLPQSRPPIGESHPVDAPPTVLTIGSIEGRKNHLALLDACGALWERGEKFRLHMIGLAQAKTGGPALEKLRALQAAGRPLIYDGPVSDAKVDAAYAAATFTVYPSLMEGFGLPVIESLAHGKPCICSGRGALGESARGGGCIALDRVDSASIATTIARLLGDPSELARLSAEIRARNFKTWIEYADQITAWMDELRNEPRAISTPAV